MVGLAGLNLSLGLGHLKTPQTGLPSPGTCPPQDVVTIILGSDDLNLTLNHL